MVWDAFKAVMRGHFISVASAHKKAKGKVVSDIKANIAFLEAKLIRYGGKKYLHKLELETKKLALYETSQAQRNLLLLKQKYASRSLLFLRRLSWKASRTLSSNFINRIGGKNGGMVNSSTQIQEEFQKFYQQLHTSSSPNIQTIEEYLATSKFGIRFWYQIWYQDLLEEPVTTIEVLATIQRLKSHKTPGRDGLPAEFYNLHQFTPI